jgi:demethylmenaquinone methyltransferase/2-methoxy-6-polyprenyl-1,4-benzoquinol methylase
MLRSWRVTNKFIVAGEERAARVQDLFAAVAPRYDLINDLQSFGLHRYWKRRVLTLATVRPGMRALDLCCGTGDIALALAREGAEVVGLDFSAPMLAVAQQRLENSCAQKNSSVQFLQGDAQHIPFPDASFDIVTIGYGLRNLANLDAGLREIQRVARPGARLLALDFGRPDNALWREIYFAYLGKFVPWMGRIFCGDPDTHSYILESLLHYAGQHGVAARMEALGLINTRIINFMGGVMSINYAEKPR